MKTILAFTMLVTTGIALTACVGVPQTGEEGAKCFKNGTCRGDLVCDKNNVCSRQPAKDLDGGQRDTNKSPSDTGHQNRGDGDDETSQDTATSDTDSVEEGPETSADVADAGETDAGLDTGTDAGCTPPNCQNCGPSPTGKGGDMCEVLGGPFWMGCNSAVDTECENSEKPYHEVSVSAFKIDRFEVTVTEYKTCVMAGGCTPADNGNGCNYYLGGKEKHPINCVDWNKAHTYCSWAGKKLPAEAQWEKAARGTDGRKYPWGNTNLDCDHAIHSVNRCVNSETAEVGSKPLGASPYGALDLIGNVWEWVQDDYHPDYSGAPTNGDPWVDNPRSELRVLRGGGWIYGSTRDLRASYRYQDYATSRNNHVGFRCSFND